MTSVNAAKRFSSPFCLGKLPLARGKGAARCLAASPARE